MRSDKVGVGIIGVQACRSVSVLRSRFLTDIARNRRCRPWPLTQVYVRVAADVRDGTRPYPGVDEAVMRHRIKAAIRESSASGKLVHRN